MGAQGRTNSTRAVLRAVICGTGAVEVLYGQHEQFWALPQDGSLGKKWAIAESTGCTVNDSNLKCGRAAVTEKPADKPETPNGIIYLNAHTQYFADGCLECHVEGITPDNAGPPSMQQATCIDHSSSGWNSGPRLGGLSAK